MIENGRILCINPSCRRTAAVEKHPNSNEIVCRKCWRKVPQRMRDRYSTLRRRGRRIERFAVKRAAQGAVERAKLHHVESLFDGQFRRNWSRIRDYFLAPDRPVGLEGFLKEVGL